ncbi:MAG: septum formation inhibitor Maf [Candidatus Dadabacteria bacterium]|nr:MAG: septum formation inhibitor Maf [Candidatus Dadabacteria bacterium]MCL4245765.1 septum formation inhibitor Maf [Candidatus Dadabacteria bacterium]
MSQRLVLASSSPRRKKLLESLGLSIEVIIPSADEDILGGESPGEFASRVAFEKAASVSRGLDSDSVVLGADTIVVVDDTVLGKPLDENDAARMLGLLSGKEHYVLTAFSIVRPREELLHAEIVSTAVRVCELAASDIEGYIKTGEPMDKAGAYGIQGVGAFMVEGVTGSYTNVVGLPLPEVLRALTKLGAVRLFGRDES